MNRTLFGLAGLMLLLLAGCRQRKPLPDKESMAADSVQYMTEGMDSLQQRADTDTAFRKSEAYSQEMGLRAIARNKALYRLSPSDRLLAEYEATAGTLGRLNQMVAHNPAFKKDVRLMTRIKDYGEKAYALEKQLEQKKLSNSQQLKLKDIKEQITNSMN